MLLLGNITPVVLASAPPITSGVSSNLNITAYSYNFAPTAIGDLALDATIHVQFTDTDSHGGSFTFTIIKREGYVIPWNISHANLQNLSYGAMAGEGNLVNVNATGFGGLFTASFTSPAKTGWYEFVSTYSGQFQAGMYGFVAFGEPIPQAYTIIFDETDLPSGTNWSVDLNGTLEISNGSQIVFNELDGTFFYSASAAGYTGQTGTVTVNGANPAPIEVYLTPPTAPSPGFRFTAYVVLGGGAAVVAFGLVTVLLVNRHEVPPRS
ncbi:MAG: hypothetical protein ACLQD8_03060 [Thermoplasmata archaeon]